MEGKTLKQMAIDDFYAARDAFVAAKKAFLDDPASSGAKQAYISASVRLHAAKGLVPKKFWKGLSKL